MCEACHSEFDTVGDNALAYVGTGKMHVDTRYTKSTPRNTMGRGASPTGSTGGVRGSTMGERTGPKFTPQMKLYSQNAAEASSVERRTYVVPSKAGSGDFWSERARQGQSY